MEGLATLSLSMRVSILMLPPTWLVDVYSLHSFARWNSSMREGCVSPPCGISEHAWCGRTRKPLVALVGTTNQLYLVGQLTFPLATCRLITTPWLAVQVQLNRVTQRCFGRVFCKLESLNPMRRCVQVRMRKSSFRYVRQFMLTLHAFAHSLCLLAFLQREGPYRI